MTNRHPDCRPSDPHREQIYSDAYEAAVALSEPLSLQDHYAVAYPARDHLERLRALARYSRIMADDKREG